MSHDKRVALGFLLAPIPPCVLVLFSVFAASGFENWVTPLIALPYYLLGCYIITILLALPLYLVLSTFFRVTLARCLFCGFLVGWLPVFLLATNDHFTAAELRSGFEPAVGAGGFGAAIALMFWLIAFWRRPQDDQNRRDIPT